jgi:hypothetical protein
MPEPNQYTFDYRELAEALVKQAGLHEGRWQVVMTFGLGAANMGPTEAHVVPGAAVAVTSVGLLKATETSPSALVVDAAVVNPSTREDKRGDQREPLK